MDFELTQISDCKSLSEQIKPFKPWSFKDGVKVYDEEKFEENKENAEALVYHVEQCYSVGTLIRRDIFDLCYQLSTIYKLCGSIEVLGNENDSAGGYTDKRCSFNYIVSVMGLSRTSAYLYKDIGALFIDNYGKISDKFKNYSFSLLAEMVSLRNCFYINFSHITGIIPPDSTIEDVRKYKKIMFLYGNGREPFEVFCADSLRDKITDSTTLKEVLQIYNEWEQSKAIKDLEEKLSGSSVTVTDTPPRDSTVDDVVNFYKKRISDLEYQVNITCVPDLGNCDGCRYKDNNLNKCRCCRRYTKLKDLYEI